MFRPIRSVLKYKVHSVILSLVLCFLTFYDVTFCDRLCEQLLAPDQMDTPNMTASTMAGVDNDRGASASMGTSMSSVWATAVNSPGPTTITQIKMLDSIAKPQPQSQPVRECARVRVVFLTDVAGVFDRAPHLPGARLIPHIIVNRDGSVSVHCHVFCCYSSFFSIA